MLGFFRISSCETDAGLMNACTRNAVGALVDALHSAPPACFAGAHILGWAPLNRNTPPGRLDTWPTLHSSLAERLGHTGIAEPSGDPSATPLIVAQLGWTSPRFRDQEPTFEADLVASVASQPHGARPRG